MAKADLIRRWTEKPKRSPKQQALDTQIELVKEILVLKKVRLTEGGIVGLLKRFGDVETLCGAILDSCRNGQPPKSLYPWLITYATKEENLSRARLCYHQWIKTT